MYNIFLGLTLLQQFRPYFRKHISNTLDPHEYFLLNTMAIMVLISMYIAFLLLTKKTSCGKIMSNIKTLNGSEIGCILMLALITVISGLLLFELDKNYNTPLINSMFLKAVSMIALVCVGIFIFKENYKIHQFIGIFLVILGMYLISQNTLDF
jgi:drug/metabolite transporter (DMT)-like permease